MARGRPPLQDDDRLIHVSLRLPKDVVDFFRLSPRYTGEMRRVLERYARGEFSD